MFLSKTWNLDNFYTYFGIFFTIVIEPNYSESPGMCSTLLYILSVVWKIHLWTLNHSFNIDVCAILLINSFPHKQPDDYRNAISVLGNSSVYMNASRKKCTFAAIWTRSGIFSLPKVHRETPDGCLTPTMRSWLHPIRNELLKRLSSFMQLNAWNHAMPKGA